MPFINQLLDYTNEYFIETGTYRGDTLEIIKNNYKNVYSVELSNVFYNNSVNRFKHDKNIKIFFGNSRYDLFNIITNINCPITFWLDSHWSGVEHVGCDKDVLCPVLYELEQIKQHNIKSHTIMIDDIRLMDGVNFKVTKEEILNKLYEINPDYKIVYYDDYTAKNDVLVAYIDTTNEKKICIHKYLKVCKTNPQPPGLGDFIRGSIALFNYCQKYNYRLLFDNEHELFEVLEKNENIINNNILTSTIELIPPIDYNEIDIKLENLFLENKNFCVLTNAFYKKENGEINYLSHVSDSCKSFIRNIFTPNEIIVNNIENVFKKLNIDLNKKYNILHLRFGDKYIHNNNEFDNNEYKYITEKIKNLLLENTDEQFILLSDSSKMAVELSLNNPALFYFDNNKIHMGDLIYGGDVKNVVIDTMTDFFIMSKCNKIFSYPGSGFSYMASILFDKPNINI